MDAKQPVSITTIFSSTLNREMTIRVAKDASVDIETILLMHDGQNLFSDMDASYGMSWNILQGIDISKSKMMIVGVDCGEGLARLDEYSPFVNHHLQDVVDWIDRPVGGQGKKYIDFLVYELLPKLYQKIGKEVPVVLGGSSMGGYISLAAAAYYPPIFQSVMSFSGALWFEMPSLLKLLESADLSQLSVYMDTGTLESKEPLENDAYLKTNRSIASLLKSKAKKCYYHEFEGEKHNEKAWAKRIGPAVDWIFA